MAIQLKVNGTTRSVAAEPDTPLLYVLRNDFELNGAKFGCGLAQCGACTVLVDGKATLSCVTPIGTLGQSEITTIEGLGTIEKPHPLQRAFIDEQAAQCGYCINGMIMTAKELLDRKFRSRPRQMCAPGSMPIFAAAARTDGSSGRCSSCRSGGEDLNMNVITPTRREFTAGLGAIVVAFSLDPKLALAQQSAPLPGSLAPTACSMPGSASTRTAAPPSSPARSSSDRASPPRSPRSRPKSSTCRSPASRPYDGYKPQPERGRHLRQPVDRIWAAPRCGLPSAEVRGSCSSSRPNASASPPIRSPSSMEPSRSADGRQVSYGELAARGRSASRGDGEGRAQAAGGS